VEHASGHGLQYLVESEFAHVVPFRFPAEVGEQLQQMSTDTIDMEQYLDFLNHRTFRRTLLCHEEIEVDRQISPEDIFDLYLVSRAHQATDKPEDVSKNLAQFTGHDGARFTTDHPMTKAAFIYLSQIYPRAETFKDVVKAAVKAAPLPKGKSLKEHTRFMAGNFLRAYGYSESLVQLQIHPSRYLATINDKPEASAVARFQLDHVIKVTNLRHERVELDDFSRHLLRKVDGSNTREVLIQMMLEAYNDGQVIMDIEDPPEPGTDSAKDLITASTDKRLRFFARAALLVA
jgi:methyltransferase-like protein